MSNPLARLYMLRRAVWWVCAVAFAGVGQTGRGATAPTFGELPAVDDRWVHFVSPNFELFSHQGEADSRAILYDLELLRALFMERFKFIERARLDVTVYSFRSRKDFKAYSSYAKERKLPIAGFYMARPDRAVIVLAPSDDRDDARQLVFHEYVHHLFRAAEADPPPWFDEGMAELLAGIRVEGDTLQFGHPVIGRLLSLRNEKLLSLDTVFNVSRRSSIYRSGEHKGLFYAQSWALVHYWYCGTSELPADGISRFVAAATGEKKLEPGQMQVLFQECFAMDYAEMVKQLERYVRSGRYTYATMPLPALAPARSYESRALGAGEIRLRLAELAVRVNGSALGRTVVFQESFGSTPDPRTLELMGALAAAEGDSVSAAEHWEKAVAAGSTNRAILRELALIEGRTWFREFDYGLKIPDEDAERMRTRLLRSIQHEPHQTAAYETLAWVEACAEHRSVANVNLVQANFKQLPRKSRTLVALALVRARMGARDDALKLLSSVAKLDPDLWTLQAAEVISATLEGRPVQHLTSQARGAREIVSDLTPNFTVMRRLPGVPLPDDL